MKCEICKVNDATVFVKHVANGVVKKMHVCEECAEQKGVDVHLPVPLLGDLLFGATDERPSARAAAGNKTCPVCHMRRSHFRKTSLLGCPACYEAFADEVAQFLGMDPDTQTYEGKIPSREKTTAEIAALEKRLRDAISVQNYEEAAQLRDRLSDVKGRGRKDRHDASKITGKSQ